MKTPMPWFRKGKPSAEQLLLDRFLQLETDRLSHRSDLEAKRDELEVRKLEIELAHLEARTKSQIELDAARQELLLKRREAGRLGQRARRAKARGEVANGSGGFCCPLGENPLRRDVNVEMVRQHLLHVQGPQPDLLQETRGN